MGHLVCIGNSFEIKEELKAKYGFRFDWATKVWIKDGVSEDKSMYFEVVVEKLSKNVKCFWVSSLDSIETAIAEVTSLDSTPKKETYLEGHLAENKVFEMSAWYARQFKENNGTEYAFRNLKILRVLRETAKAYQVDAEFFSGIASTCGVCGRVLDNDISRATGIGPVCAERVGLPRPTMEKAKEIVKLLEAKSTAQGVFKGVWIPKSQIKKVF